MWRKKSPAHGDGEPIWCADAETLLVTPAEDEGDPAECDGGGGGGTCAGDAAAHATTAVSLLDAAAATPAVSGAGGTAAAGGGTAAAPAAAAGNGNAAPRAQPARPRPRPRKQRQTQLAINQLVWSADDSKVCCVVWRSLAVEVAVKVVVVWLQ
jgi:hypothetical protein